MADSPVGTLGLIPWGSNVVNGQLVPQAPTQAFDPLTYGPSYTGPAFYPRQGVYSIPPVVPTNGASSMGNSPSMSNINGNFPTAASETGNPFHPTKSPLLFAFGFLVAGYLMLHYIHYK